MDDSYIAFFVAMTDRDLLLETFKPFAQGKYTIGHETAPHTHLETQGKHTHIYAQMTTLQYKAFINRLKYLGVPLNGLSRGEKTRSYGKIKEGIRDDLKMLAYTIKGNDFITNEDSDRIIQAQAISYIKEDSIATLRKAICEHLDEHIEPQLSVIDDTVIITNPLTTFTLIGLFKLELIKYFRENREKMPVKTKLLYLIQYYCMYHSNLFSDSQILDLFY